MSGDGAYATLVDAPTLAAHLDDANWLVFDCRHQLADPDYGARAYAAGHVPGARFVHLDRDLSAAQNGANGRHPLPDPATLAARLAALGVGDATQVVAYDDAGGMIAARLWWLLRWLGHPRVALLDGGFPAWQAAALPVSVALPSPVPGSLTPPSAAVLGAAVVDAATIEAELGGPGRRLVDSRSAERYRGENETIDPFGGHIPGARNRFFGDNLARDGRFRPAAELRDELLAALAGAAPEETVFYCGSGVSACHNLLAMAIAGLPGARLYPGSWSEWCTPGADGMPGRPLAR